MAPFKKCHQGPKHIDTSGLVRMCRFSSNSLPTVLNCAPLDLLLQLYFDQRYIIPTHLVKRFNDIQSHLTGEEPQENIWEMVANHLV